MTTKPQDWLFGFSMPLDRAGYDAQLARPDSFDLLQQLPGGWRAYRDGLLAPSIEALDFYRTLGVRVETDFTVAKMEELCRHLGRNKAFTLVAHWTDHGVELADGIVPFEAVVEAVPPLYDGIVDLCVCHPIPLVAALRLRRPALRAVKYVDAPVSLLLWLRLYKALFALLASRDVDADDALQGWVGAAIEVAAKGEGREWVVRS